MGIFSRDDSRYYQWLSQSLESSSAVKSVNHCYISNNFPAFQEEVRNCTFAILYHTTKHGRLNLTNVTDSLYDKELQHLHDKLGKDNVIVVIDDVEDGRKQETQILAEQPSIGKLAHGLFLFSEMDKAENGEDTEDSPLITSSNKEKKLIHIIPIIQAHNIRQMWKYSGPLIFRSVGLLVSVTFGIILLSKIYSTWNRT